ncbi:MAG: PPC domain-containing protein [Eubacterium sp.]|nr:PPC domain-containing protein [Eubacterium sp.]
MKKGFIKMKKTMKILIIFIVLFIVGMAVVLFCSNQEGFTGSRIKNPDSYMLDIERMNGTDLHTLDLQTGDALQIRFETVKGSLYMEIHAPDGTVIYRGNGKETTDFTVNIPESGAYSVVVEARYAKGTINIHRV